MRNVKTVINRYRWLFNLVQLFGDNPPFPLLILVHLTGACQCACPMCYQRVGTFTRRGCDPMDIELFEALLRQAGSFLRRPLIHLYGGEPLLHPRFPEVLTLLSQHGFQATINTNGELLLPYASVLAKGPVRMINVSLDAMGTAHDELRRRPGLFDQALQGMRALRARDGGISLNVNYVVNSRNARTLWDDLLGFESAFRGMRLDYVSIEHLAYTREMAHLARAIDVAALEETLTRVQAHNFPFPVSATPIVEIADLHRYYRTMDPFERVNCNVPWIGLNVFPEGDVTPGGAMFTCTRVVGSLHREGLADIWSGHGLRLFRRRIRGAMPEDCLRCCHTMHYSPLVRCRPAAKSHGG